MTITIELSFEKEEILREEAERRGMKVADYAAKLLTDHLPKRSIVAEGGALEKALEGIIGAIDGSERNGGQPSRLSEVELFEVPF